MSEMITCTNERGEKFECKVEDLEYRPSVYAVIVKDGAVLLSQQWNGYDFPGGKIDLGETIVDALHREVFEETGVKVKIQENVLVGDSFFYHPRKKKPFQSILLYYKAEYLSGKLTCANADAGELAYIGQPEWVPLEKVREVKFYNGIDSVALIEKVAQQ